MFWWCLGALFLWCVWQLQCQCGSEIPVSPKNQKVNVQSHSPFRKQDFILPRQGGEGDAGGQLCIDPSRKQLHCEWFPCSPFYNFYSIYFNFYILKHTHNLWETNCKSLEVYCWEDQSRSIKDPQDRCEIAVHFHHAQVFLPFFTWRTSCVQRMIYYVHKLNVSPRPCAKRELNEANASDMKSTPFISSGCIAVPPLPSLPQEDFIFHISLSLSSTGVLRRLQATR